MQASLLLALTVLLCAPLTARADDLIVLLQTRSCPHCKLADSDLVHADLRDVDLQGADLQRANLGRAQLDGADLRAVLLLPIYHRQTRACDGWQTHYYTLSVIQNAQRNRTPHEKQARIWRTAVRKPPIAPIEPSTWPALAIRYCRPIIIGA